MLRWLMQRTALQIAKRSTGKTKINYYENNIPLNESRKKNDDDDQTQNERMTKTKRRGNSISISESQNRT